eukprot:TRINITY_DN65761_c11_g9_i1.p1 TRINITY_DN65761_c11_g9~~TRINITY_DN65761_c11_g9_i1.p1  ORF type:complete len:378 (+),score=189.67 TRINITY_DN65761_c11_g9_i1:340-1473(+)
MNVESVLNELWAGMQSAGVASLTPEQVDAARHDYVSSLSGVKGSSDDSGQKHQYEQLIKLQKGAIGSGSEEEFFAAVQRSEQDDEAVKALVDKIVAVAGRGILTENLAATAQAAQKAAADQNGGDNGMGDDSAAGAAASNSGSNTARSLSVDTSRSGREVNTSPNNMQRAHDEVQDPRDLTRDEFVQLLVDLNLEMLEAKVKEPPPAHEEDEESSNAHNNNTSDSTQRLTSAGANDSNDNDSKAQQPQSPISPSSPSAEPFPAGFEQVMTGPIVAIMQAHQHVLKTHGINQERFDQLSQQHRADPEVSAQLRKIEHLLHDANDTFARPAPRPIGRKPKRGAPKSLRCCGSLIRSDSVSDLSESDEDDDEEDDVCVIL